MNALVVRDGLRTIELETPHFSGVHNFEFFWLGIRDGNIAFEDSLDFDISEIESIYEHQEDNER